MFAHNCLFINVYIHLGKSSSPFCMVHFQTVLYKVPSIATVKKFSLPGLVPPLKVLLYVKFKVWVMDIILYSISTALQNHSAITNYVSLVVQHRFKYVNF